MKEKIKKALEEIKNSSGKERTSVKFSHRAPSLNKSVKGEIVIGIDRTLQVNLIEINGYNPKYIKHAANTFLKTALLSDIAVGSIVWTLYEGETSVGETYTLAKNSNYYGVGLNSYIDCNGIEFSTNVKAKFLQNKPGTCKPGKGRDYKLFQIITL